MSFLKTTPGADLKTILRLDPNLGAPLAEYHEALLRGPSPFTVAERELIAAYVSGLNACDFCLGEHAAVAELYGIDEGLIDALLGDLEAAPVAEKLRVVLRFVTKLNDEPGKITARDAEAVFAAGWSDTALYHAVSICALFNLSNRLINGLGIPPHGAGKLAVTAERLHDHGYASTMDFIRGDWDE